MGEEEKGECEVCVIFWANKERPSDYMVERAFERNNDGAGGAYREKNPDTGQWEVVWKKGLDLDQIKEFCKTAPIPFVAHFRIATIGGARPSLTHPFPINENVPLALEGRTTDSVLFHNGTWREWDVVSRQAAISANVPLPWGRFSDTRALAYIISLFGNYMEFLPEQKAVIFGPRETHIFDGKPPDGWSKINEVWCSNDHFMKGQVHVVGNANASMSQVQGAVHQPTNRGVGTGKTFCRYGGPGAQGCTNQTLDEQGFCFVHPNGQPRMHTFDRVATAKPTGGSVVPPSPFVQKAQQQEALPQARLPLELPSGEVISIELAEYLHKEKQLSKKKLNKIKMLWDKATNPNKNPRKAQRAELALRQLSISLMAKPQSNGSVH